MVRQIVRKEILENVLGLRFSLSLLLAIALFTTSGFVFLGRHAKQSQDYWKGTNDNLGALREQSGQLFRLAFHRQNVFLKPKPLTFCVEGFEKSLPNRFTFNAFTAELPAIEGRENFILPHFSEIDWVFIISLFLSFVALAFTYDSICEEKEQGTLRLILAGAIPRYKVLLGKYLAAMFTLGAPLLTGLLVSLMIVVSSTDIAIGPGDWLRILTLVLWSFLYLSVFVLLGLFVSSRTAHSANSMVILLLAWVGLVILLPSFGRIVSDVSSKGLMRADLERRLAEVTRQIWESHERFGKNAGHMSPNPNDPGNNPPARARLVTAVTEATNQIRNDHHNRLVAQTLAGRTFTCLSPTVIYQRAAEAIAGTGISHCVDLYQQIKLYQTDLREYIRAKDAEDPDSLHLIFDEQGCAQRWKTISHKPVDFATVPKFQERDLALGKSLRLAIWDIGLLLLFNLVFFAAAFVSFLRYDVR